MLYERLGFTDVQTRMAVPLATLEQRAGGRPGRRALAGRSCIVQTDDQAAIVAAVGALRPAALPLRGDRGLERAAKRLGLGQRRSWEH